jgi:hypothetical protein
MLLCDVIVCFGSEACGRGRVKEALTPLLADMQVSIHTPQYRQSHIHKERDKHRTQHNVMSMDRD